MCLSFQIIMKRTVRGKIVAKDTFTLHIFTVNFETKADEMIKMCQFYIKCSIKK